MKATVISALWAAFSISLVTSTTLPSLLQKRSPNKLMIFDCVNDGLGDVCDNMCFGANCDINGKTWGESFTWDKPSKSVGGMRSTKAGCGSSNRCSKSPYGSGYQCDEYPFKSVKESDAGGQVNRCVKSGYNNAQSQVIRQFYNSQADFKGTGCAGNAPCAFNIVFSNAGNIGSCNPSPDCKNDGNEYTKSGKVPDPKKRRDDANINGTATGTGGYYKLASGAVIFSPGPVNVGDLAYKTVQKNATLYNQYNWEHQYDPDQGMEQYDYMMHNLDLEEDTVVDNADGPN